MLAKGIVVVPCCAGIAFITIKDLGIPRIQDRDKYERGRRIPLVFRFFIDIFEIYMYIFAEIHTQNRSGTWRA